MDDKIKNTSKPGVAYYHLPGLFEFYGLYRMFLPLFYHHREYFYNWCAIGSIYGALGDCIWGGGRTSFGVQDPEDVMDLMREYGISARLTFSNSLLREEHLADIKCNALCKSDLKIAAAHKTALLSIRTCCSDIWKAVIRGFTLFHLQPRCSRNSRSYRRN